MQAPESHPPGPSAKSAGEEQVSTQEAAEETLQGGSQPSSTKENPIEEGTNEENSQEFINDCLTLAKEGHLEHQLFIARHYLKVVRAGIGLGPDDAAAKQAVEWLIKASREGNGDATSLLQEFLEEGIGMVPDNLNEVSWCINTPYVEKVARIAAKNLFKKLSPMEHLSSDEYQRAVQKADGVGRAEKKLLKKAGKIRGTDTVTEEVFVEKMVKRLQGTGSIVVPAFLQTDVEEEAYANTAIWKRVYKYPGKTAMVVVDYTVETASRQGGTWIRSLIPTQQIHVLMVLFLYSFLSLHFLQTAIPTFLFYVSLAAMVISTLQMFYARRKLNDIKTVVGMLNRFNDVINTDSVTSEYNWKSLTPYFVFFTSLLAHVIGFPLAASSWVPTSELTLVAAFLFAASFFALSDEHDSLALLSIACDMISTLPRLLPLLPQIPVVYQILNFLIGLGVSLEIWPDLYINISLPSLAYLFVPVIFIKMAVKGSWKGTYRILIPHLVCFLWWQVMVLYYSKSTWIGLLRASAGWLTVLFLLPFVVIGAIGYLASLLAEMLTLSGLFKVLTTFLLLAIPAAVALWSKRGLPKQLERHGKKIQIIMVCLSFFAVISLLFVLTPSERDVRGEYITWEQYKRFCSMPQWEKTNIAHAQLQCEQLDLMMVEWSGTIRKVVVKETENQASRFIALLPVVLADWLRCTYGVENPPCESVTDPTKQELCKLQTMQGRKCHLGNLNKHKFEIWVHMPVDNETTHDVRVEANHWFKDTVLKLKSGDGVTFRASLQTEMGNIWPTLRLYHLQCTTCKPPFISSGDYQQSIHSFAARVKRALMDGWNFFLAPVVEFKSD